MQVYVNNQYKTVINSYLQLYGANEKKVMMIEDDKEVEYDEKGE